MMDKQVKEIKERRKAWVKIKWAIDSPIAEILNDNGILIAKLENAEREWKGAAHANDTAAKALVQRDALQVKIKHLIKIYFEGCDEDEFDDAMRELNLTEKGVQDGKI